jgi:hypothetical protein
LVHFGVAGRSKAWGEQVTVAATTTFPLPDSGLSAKLSAMFTLRRLRSIVYAVTFFNFVAFIIGTIVIGGDAVNGHAKDGHYFVANRGHLTEVSRAVFICSKAHVFSVWITFALAGLVTWLAHDEDR